MNRRDENIALRGLTTAVEAHTVLLRSIIDKLNDIDSHIGTLIDTVAEHIANPTAHGGES